MPGECGPVPGWCGPLSTFAMAIKPLYAGLRAHVPGKQGGTHPVDLDSVYEAQSPGLVSRADWYAVQRLLRAPERKTSRPGRAKHLLSRIARYAA